MSQHLSFVELIRCILHMLCLDLGLSFSPNRELQLMWLLFISIDQLCLIELAHIFFKLNMSIVVWIATLIAQLSSLWLSSLLVCHAWGARLIPTLLLTRSILLRLWNLVELDVGLLDWPVLGAHQRAWIHLGTHAHRSSSSLMLSCREVRRLESRLVVPRALTFTSHWWVLWDSWACSPAAQ